MANEESMLQMIGEKLYATAPAYIVDSVDQLPREMASDLDRGDLNSQFIWIAGRYVQANQANKNGHLWTFDDLQKGEASIRYTPLNVLHKYDRPVGTIVQTKVVQREEAGTNRILPEIQALSVFWNFNFPDLGKLIRAAHESQNLWYCVDSETEAMTADGWKPYTEIEVGTVILTLNTTSGMSEWTPVESVFSDLVDTEMVRMEGTGHSSLTTPDHRWWTRWRNGRSGQYEMQWRTSDTLVADAAIPRAMPHSGFPAVPKYDDALVELVGWFWTEGTDNGTGIVIYQSEVVNPDNVSSIRAALTTLYGSPARVRDGGLWYETSPQDVVHFHLSKEAASPIRDLAPDRVVSAEFLRSLTLSQLRMFVEISIAADGTVAKADGQVSLSQASEERIRAFEMACALLGRPTVTSQVGDNLWRIGLVSRSSFVSPVRLGNMGNGFLVGREQYRGVVWCPTTPNGTFLARRNGTVYWTGNSMECVAESKQCMECEEVFPFYAAAHETCKHLGENQKAPRRFINPTFLGGALIFPPERPAWADADITEMARELTRQYAFRTTPTNMSVDEWSSMMDMAARWA